MKRLFLLTILIVILAAFFASAAPDGLDFVSQKLGFAHKTVEASSLVAGIPTLLAGIMGILIIIGIFYFVALISKRTWISLTFLIPLIPLISLLFVPSAFAARPLITDDFYTVTQGGYELEIGYASTQNQTCLTNAADLSLKRGLLSNLDLGIEVPYTFSDEPGLNDILLHAKYCFWKPDEDAGLTARVDYKFNNGDVSHGLGSGYNDYSLMIIGSKMFGKTKTHVNLGYVKVGVNACVTSYDYLSYSFAMEHPVWGERGDLVAEYVGNSALNRHPGFIQIGARYVVSEGFKLDAAYSVGLNDNSIKNSATAGFHYEF
ncbi:MAG: transporter [Candidatus Saganbacteria bacterium]|nr:transporter [Candidatus Saganbacteria bacterium]